MNPGTGPVPGASFDNARVNAQQLAHEVGGEVIAEHEESFEGRYRFTVTGADGRAREVDMPGLPLEQVRFMSGPDQNIWDYPRLYVDGSSWVWLYALHQFQPE